MKKNELDHEGINAGLLAFLDRSPVGFFAVKNMEDSLREAGFVQLREQDPWQVEAGGAYYVTRNGSALIAFRIPAVDSGELAGFQIMASHCDSPVFKVKTNAEVAVNNRYMKLNVEKYGGLLCAPWLDRPLSVAGRVVVETEEGIETRLVNLDRDLLVIPNLAIHMNREANNGYSWNAQTDLLPLFGEIPQEKMEMKIPQEETEIPREKAEIPREKAEISLEKAEIPREETDVISTSVGEKGPEDGPAEGSAREQEGEKERIRKTAEGAFLRLIAEEAGVRPEQILDTDLYLYNRMKGTYVGVNREFIMSGRLDDLQCAYASLQGILRAKPVRSIAVHCVLDNEEVGSGSRQGAAGTFLADVLRRINEALGRTGVDYLRMLSSSFMVSADNAHSVHPNHPEKADPTNRPYMNGGIVIKYSANQKYTTDAVSGAIFRRICRAAGVPVQTFANRSDMIGGSTLGNISQSQVSVNTVDVGLAQLAMHSPYETAGARDTACLAEAARVLFSSTIEAAGDGNYRILL